MLILMFVNTVIGIIVQRDMLIAGGKISDDRTTVLIFQTINISCDYFKSWLFASQYLKTSILLPRFIRTKVTLLRIFTEKAEHEHRVKPLTGTFLIRHDEFDSIIKVE